MTSATTEARDERVLTDEQIQICLMSFNAEALRKLRTHVQLGCDLTHEQLLEALTMAIARADRERLLRDRVQSYARQARDLDDVVRLQRESTKRLAGSLTQQVEF